MDEGESQLNIKKEIYLEKNCTKIAINLLNVLENLFFSMKIPPEIVSKYNILKESAYKEMDLPFSPINESIYAHKTEPGGLSSGRSRGKESDEGSFKSIDSALTYLPLLKNITSMSELVVESLLEKLLNFEKFCKNQDSFTHEPRSIRDLDYVKQNILSDIKKIDLQRLKSLRYSEKSTGKEENFSLTISQFMYKIDNLAQKFENSLFKVQKHFNELPSAPPLSEGYAKNPHIESYKELSAQNKLLEDKIKSYEYGNYEVKSLEKQILNLKDIHSTEIKHMQTSHDKIIYELKEIHKQKEGRLQERIDLLSKTYDTGKDLYIVRDLQGALDKIRAITKPIYSSKIRNFPDFEQLQNERLEVVYADFVVFLAKQAIGFLDKLEDPHYDVEQKYQNFENQEDNKDLNLSHKFARESSYPSVTNLHSQNDQNHFQNSPKKTVEENTAEEAMSVVDIDIEKALKIQQEFQRQHGLLSEHLDSFSRKSDIQEKENSPINPYHQQRLNHHPGTISVPNFAPAPFSQRDADETSPVTYRHNEQAENVGAFSKMDEVVRSQRNLARDKERYVTLSQDNSLERMSHEPIGKFLLALQALSQQVSSSIEVRT
ncbi:unnamed protein product [Moneuplotes crassus]|uniref:Uncharacterized protein n=1 Tax=Euplotes crassus TaxID=5936 RepID=A0AAD1UBA3_EUPCR|nr:unnamed protein product [Moneuplotes crassus]